MEFGLLVVLAQDNCYTGNMKRRIVAVLLFVLVGVFFVASYFLMTTSGEDVLQGANTPPNVLGDAMAAFSYNARLSDMYAWSVINFFGYQYVFGVDTVFRLVDVVMGVGVIYCIAYLALGQRLQLRLRDAAVFAMGFLAVFLTPFGRVFYVGFSIIHNYLLIAIISLVFALPYLRKLRGGEVGKGLGFALVMLVAGVVFGCSSNLVPVAFLLTLATVLIVRMVRTRKVMAVLRRVERWEILSVVGILIGMGIEYLLGPGVSGYINNGYAVDYDYVSMTQMFTTPGESIARLVKHLVFNFGRVLAPVIIILMVVAIVVVVRQWWQKGKIKGAFIIRPEAHGVVAVLAVFVFWHVLIAVQLAAPVRILSSAYLAAVIAILIILNEWTRKWRMRLASVLLVVGVGTIVMIRMALAVQYHEKAGLVLDKIRESEGAIVCVTREEVRGYELPLIHLGQEDMLADWAMPQRVYGKEVVWCE